METQGMKRRSTLDAAIAIFFMSAGAISVLIVLAAIALSIRDHETPQVGQIAIPLILSVLPMILGIRWWRKCNNGE
jgi:hypothetical protein